MPLLSLDRVSKRFDGVTAVDQVSFAVDRGQVVGFLGPNGAGKTTTMRLITQFYEPDEGAITLDGVALAVAAREAKRRIGYLAENNPLYGEMLVADYLAFIADLRELAGASRARSLDEAVTATGIEGVFYRPIGELSKGYRQRVGLAQAILHRPDLLVLDEPTEGLDPNQRAATAASPSRSPPTAVPTCGPRSSRSRRPAAGRCTSCTRRPGVWRSCSASSPRAATRETRPADGVDGGAARAADAGRPAHGLHPARGVRRRERLPVLPPDRVVRRGNAATDARFPPLAAPVPRSRRDDARARRGRALGHARGRAGPARHRAGARARQVPRRAAVPVDRARAHPPHPARARPGRAVAAGGRVRAVRGLGAAHRGHRRRRAVGLEREQEPGHGLHPRRRRDVPARARGARPAARRPAAPAPPGRGGGRRAAPSRHDQAVRLGFAAFGGGVSQARRRRPDRRLPCGRPRQGARRRARSLG